MGTWSNREDHCRICEGSDLVPLLSLGETPLANRLLTPETLEEPEPTFPLELVFCPQCSLVQITETVDPELLFGHYLYLSSFSDTMVRHAEELVDRLVRERRLGPSSLAAEVASNDGYLLQHYVNRGVQVLGIEPARNIAAVAEEKGIRTRSIFFGKDAALDLVAEGFAPDVIHANNVLAHVADLRGVAAGFKILLADGGVVIIEAPYVKPMLDHCEFDTIYHEHLCYFSLRAVETLFAQQDMVVTHVERLAIHGGSIRYYVAHETAETVPSEALEALRAEEESWGVDSVDAYLDFAKKVETLRRELSALLLRLRNQGKRIAAYGAAAKGSTLLNYCRLPAGTLTFVADRSTVKQGHFMPGVRLPIRSPDALLQERPDYVLLLVWNFAEEVMKQQAEYRAGGGRFIIPVPSPRVV